MNGGRGSCGLWAVEKHYVSFREAKKFTLLQFHMQGMLILLGAK
jgi:hypothetical protein